MKCAYAVFDLLNGDDPVFTGECYLFDLPRRVFTLGSSQFIKVVKIFQETEA